MPTTPSPLGPFRSVRQIVNAIAIFVIVFLIFSLAWDASFSDMSFAESFTEALRTLAFGAVFLAGWALFVSWRRKRQR